METIAAEAKLGQDVVVTALKQFSNAGLLENGAELATSTNLSRRRVLVDVGLAVPIILMVIAPGAAAAASCLSTGKTCSPAEPCCTTGVPCSVGTCE
jgi:hypothetical protein